DVRSIALRGGESGEPAIVPGSSAKSALIRRVTSSDEDEVMPPEGKRLSANEVQLLRAWIDAGASWPDALSGETRLPQNHWAFRQPVRPRAPPLKTQDWPRTPTDRFVLARLEKEGLNLSDTADRVTLLRRLSLDLIGLPPTIREVDDFLADTSER